jgi:hypothetical protein
MPNPCLTARPPETGGHRKQFAFGAASSCRLFIAVVLGASLATGGVAEGERGTFAIIVAAVLLAAVAIAGVLLASGNSTGCEANRFLEVQSVIRRHIEEANAAGDHERAAAIGRVSEEATRRSGERSAEYQSIADEILRRAQEAFAAVQQRMLERYGETVGYAVCPKAVLAGLGVS